MRHRLALACAAVGLAAVAVAGSTRTGLPAAYPIPPRPLRMLVEEAEFIVVASVRASDPGIVALDFEQVLKGEPSRADAYLLEDHAVCPAPARYVAGTRVLAFLDRKYATHARSYGAKTLDEESLVVYVQRVKEQLAILAMEEGEARLLAQVEWLVTCAEHPATRWEGAYELAPAGDFMPEYDDRPPAGHAFAAALSDGQRARLREAFMASTRFESGEQCLEELFKDDPAPQVLAWLVARLREHVDHDMSARFGSASTLVERIARRDPRREVQQIAEAFSSVGSGSAGQERERQRAERLRIAERLVALY